MNVLECRKGVSGAFLNIQERLVVSHPLLMDKAFSSGGSGMVRYQKQLAYKYKKKEHFKHVVLVSSKAAKELGWKPGQELKEEVAGQTLVVYPKPPQKTSRKARKQ